jgi:NAD-dependent DNA ligase
MKLSEMNREQLENYVDGGEYSDQDVIDLFEDLSNQKAITELAVKGLEWYADDNNYTYDSVNMPECLADRGDNAKLALEQIAKLSHE